MLQILQQKYLDLGGEVLYDHKYKSINQDEIKITFTNNLEYEVNHILACDGINSSVREEFFPMNGPAIYSGYQAWRGIGKAQQTEAKFYFSKGKHIVSYPINNKGEVSFTAVVKNDLNTSDSWRIKGSKQNYFKTLMNLIKKFSLCLIRLTKYTSGVFILGLF